MSSLDTTAPPVRGGTLLLDKSALHGLSFAKCDELARSFNLLVTDVLMYELAADVVKYPENKVKELANKLIKFRLYYNLPFWELTVRSLCGDDILMGGVPLVLEHPKPGSSESAFQKWLHLMAHSNAQPSDFPQAEEWNSKLKNLDPHAHQKVVQILCADLNITDEPDVIVQKILQSPSNTNLLIGYLKDLFKIASTTYERIHDRLLSKPWAPIAAMASYAAFVLKIDLYFHLGLAAGRITPKLTNRVDHMYLFYLPFCKLFLTNDRTQCELARKFSSSWQTVMYGYQGV